MSNKTKHPGLMPLVLCLFALALSACGALDGRRDTRSLPGDAASFDPIAQYETARQYAGDGSILREIGRHT